MVFRRVLLASSAMFFLSVSPAAADHSYNHVLGGGRTPVVATGGETRTSGSPAGGLARTGSSDIVPMAEAATLLIGGGALLMVIGRRRRNRTTSAAA